MIRYYDRVTHTEVTEPGKDTIAYGSGIIDWWFEPLPDGYMVTYDSDGMPHKEKIPAPVPPDPIEVKKQEIRDEMNALLGDMTPAETLVLLMQYMGAKMSTDANDDSNAPSLTPDGRPILEWGDDISNQLITKLIKLRSLK